MNAPDSTLQASLLADARRTQQDCFDLGFEADARGRSFLARQVVRYPAHVGRGLYLEPALPGLCTAYLQSVSGGLFEHERVAGRIEAGPRVQAHVATAASTVVHAMQGGHALQQVRLHAGPGALLEYLPAPMILFPGSRLRTRVDVSLADDATVLLCDAFLAHDPAGGDAGFGELDATLAVRGGIEDGPLVRERLLLDGEAWRQRRLGVGGSARVHASFWVLRRAGQGELLQALRGLCGEAGAGAYAGASALPNGCGIGLRVLAADAVSVHKLLTRAWSAARLQATGHAPAMRRR